MSLPGASQAELFDAIVTIMQTEAPELTDYLEGSQLDTFAGAFSVGGAELIETALILQFAKTFFSLATGPDENGGGDDDLQTLAVDHYGDDFARPAAIAAIDTLTFSRPTSTAGAGTILAGSVIKTGPDANGNVQRYTTNSACALTSDVSGPGLSVSVGVTAVVPGKAGSAASGTINVIETTLFDPTIVCTNAGNATGEDAQDSPTYRETIKNLLISLSRATKAAIEAAAKSVPGVITATAIETAQTVIGYIIASSTTTGTYFRIVQPVLYVADATGTASPALIQAVRLALESSRACGVIPQVAAASAVSVNWTAIFALNPSGPNFSTLSQDPSKIFISMQDYINALPVGTSFVRATANAAILATWGSGGTNDLTSFTTSVPSGDVTPSATQKLIAGTMAKT